MTASLGRGFQVVTKVSAFVERGFALCPPEGGPPSGPSEKVRLDLGSVEVAPDFALPSPETARTSGSFHCSARLYRRSIRSPKSDCPNTASCANSEIH